MNVVNDVTVIVRYAIVSPIDAWTSWSIASAKLKAPLRRSMKMSLK